MDDPFLPPQMGDIGFNLETDLFDDFRNQPENIIMSDLDNLSPPPQKEQMKKTERENQIDSGFGADPFKETKVREVEMGNDNDDNNIIKDLDIINQLSNPEKKIKEIDRMFNETKVDFKF